MDDPSGGVPKRIQAMNEESCIIGLSVPVIGKGKKLHGCLANHKPQKNISFLSRGQKWNLQKSACDDGVKNELRPVLAQFRANLSFPALKMLLSGL